MSRRVDASVPQDVRGGGRLDDLFQMRADPLACNLDGAVFEMGVTLGGCKIGMAKQPADHAEIQPGVDANGCEAVAQIMQADPAEFCALPELAPNSVNPVVRHRFLTLTEHVQVAVRKGGQNPFCGTPEPDRARSGFRIWQSTAWTIDHVPAEGEGFPLAAAGEGEKAEAACLTRVGFLQPPQGSSQPGPLRLGEVSGREACLAAPQPLARVAAGRLPARARISRHLSEQ